MEIKFRDASADRIRTELLVIPLREKHLDNPALRSLDRQLKGGLRARIEKNKFAGGEGSSLLYGSAGMLPAAQILLIGLGGSELSEVEFGMRDDGPRGALEGRLDGRRAGHH